MPVNNFVLINNQSINYIIEHSILSIAVKPLADPEICQRRGHWYAASEFFFKVSIWKNKIKLNYYIEKILFKCIDHETFYNYINTKEE